MLGGIGRIALYAVLGPLVGAAGAMLAIGVVTGDWAGVAPALLSRQSLAVAYTLGLVPALLVAVVSLVLVRRVTGAAHWALAGVAGAAVSVGFAWALFGTAPVADALMPGVFSAVIGFGGALGGFVCAMLFDGIRRLTA